MTKLYTKTFFWTARQHLMYNRWIVDASSIPPQKKYICRLCLYYLYSFCLKTVIKYYIRFNINRYIKSLQEFYLFIYLFIVGVSGWEAASIYLSASYGCVKFVVGIIWTCKMNQVLVRRCHFSTHSRDQFLYNVLITFMLYPYHLLIRSPVPFETPPPPPKPNVIPSTFSFFSKLITHMQVYPSPRVHASPRG